MTQCPDYLTSLVKGGRESRPLPCVLVSIRPHTRKPIGIFPGNHVFSSRIHASNFEDLYVLQEISYQENSESLEGAWRENR
jgi:hypothetical protein